MKRLSKKIGSSVDIFPSSLSSREGSAEPQNEVDEPSQSWKRIRLTPPSSLVNSLTWSSISSFPQQNLLSTQPSGIPSSSSPTSSINQHQFEDDWKLLPKISRSSTIQGGISQIAESPNDIDILRCWSKVSMGSIESISQELNKLRVDNLALVQENNEIKKSYDSEALRSKQMEISLNAAQTFNKQLILRNESLEKEWKAYEANFERVNLKERMLGEEKRKLEEKMKRSLEEKKKLEEEKNMFEERKRVAEERKKLEEKRMMFELETKHYEEEKKKLQEDKKKLEDEKSNFEERKRFETEKKKLEEEKLKFEEERKRFLEEKKMLEEEKMKFEEGKRKVKEEKKSSEEKKKKMEKVCCVKAEVVRVSKDAVNSLLAEEQDHMKKLASNLQEKEEAVKKHAQENEALMKELDNFRKHRDLLDSSTQKLKLLEAEITNERSKRERAEAEATLEKKKKEKVESMISDLSKAFKLRLTIPDLQTKLAQLKRVYCNTVESI